MFLPEGGVSPHHAVMHHELLQPFFVDRLRRNAPALEAGIVLAANVRRTPASSHSGTTTKWG
jgi:hypothetical protein